MVKKKSWKEFQDAGLLWWVNRGLHLFGWAIVIEEEKDGSIINTYPARVSFRGFEYEDEEAGFEKLTRFMKENAADLSKDT